MRQDFFDASQCYFGSPSFCGSVPESVITRDQQPRRCEVCFLQRDRFFPIASRILQSLLSELHKSSALVHLVRFWTEPQSDFDFTRCLVMAFFVQKDSRFDRVGFGQIRIE